MKKILVVDEKGREFPDLERMFSENGAQIVCVGTDFLYENAEKPSLSDFDGLIYYGNTSNFVKKCFEAAQNADIKRATLVGSAYSYFDRTYPDKKLSEKHSFIRQANLCADEAISFCEKMSVSVAELPFIEGEWPSDFCTAKGVVGIEAGKFYLAPEGGTAEITAENASRAVYAVFVNGENGLKYPICDKSRKYKDILKEKVGDSVKIYEYPEEFDWLTVMQKKRELNKIDVAIEFDLKDIYSDFLMRNWYFDAAEVKKALKYDELFKMKAEDCPADTNK